MAGPTPEMIPITLTPEMQELALQLDIRVAKEQGPHADYTYLSHNYGSGILLLQITKEPDELNPCWDFSDLPFMDLIGSSSTETYPFGLYADLDPNDVHSYMDRVVEQKTAGHEQLKEVAGAMFQIGKTLT